MTFASSKFITLSGMSEGSTYGILPVSGDFKYIPNTDITLKYSKETITSNTVDQTRQTKDLLPVGFSVSGGFNLEFAPKVYDEYIEGAMWTDWGTPSVVPCSLAISVVGQVKTVTASVTANVFAQVVAGQYIKIAGALLNAANVGTFRVKSKTTSLIVVLDDASTVVTETIKTGVTITANMIRNPALPATSIRKSYYFEKANTDLSTPQFFSYSGNMVNSFSLSAQSKAIVTGSFDFMGKASENYPTTTRSPGGTVGAAVNTGLFNTVSHITGVRINGVYLSTLGTFLQGFDFSIGQNLRGIPAVGESGFASVNPGLISVTGKINPYFADSTMYARFLASTKFHLAIEMKNSDNDGYVISFPQCIIGDDEMSGEDVVENMSWTAVVDPTYQTTMQIDRFYASYTDCPDAPATTYVGA